MKEHFYPNGDHNRRALHTTHMAHCRDDDRFETTGVALIESGERCD